jgi:hypothetical protein
MYPKGGGSRWQARISITPNQLLNTCTMVGIQPLRQPERGSDRGAHEYLSSKIWHVNTRGPKELQIDRG